jgi:hypothetical protein
MKNIAMITTARTGSSFFTRSVQKNFNFLKGNAEIFHPNNDLEKIINNILSANKFHPRNLLKKDIDKAIREKEKYKKNPDLLLSLLNKITLELNLDGLFFKIMNGHLKNTDEDLKSLIKRDSINFFYLTRLVTDVIISALKAKKSNKWEQLDTTDYKIFVDPEEFLGTYKRFSKWLNDSYRCISKNNEIRIIKYEDIFNKENKPNEKIFNFINDFVEDKLSFIEFEALKQQDRNASWEDKISNPENIKEVMIENNIPEHFSEVCEDI